MNSASSSQSRNAAKTSDKVLPNTTIQHDSIDKVKSYLAHEELNAIQSFRESLKKSGDDKWLTIFQEYFWSEDKKKVSLLLDAINKLNPEYQKAMQDNHPNQAYKARRLRWTQADFIYCIAFEIPGNKDYYLGKVGMSQSPGVYDEVQNTTKSRYTDLIEKYHREFTQSDLGIKNMVKSYVSFKLLVSPYDSRGVQQIEKEIREKYGWEVDKSDMKSYKISEPTEWVIISKTRSDELYTQITVAKSEGRELDTRVFNDLGELSSPEISQFSWKNGDRTVTLKLLVKTEKDQSTTENSSENDIGRNKTKNTTMNENSPVLKPLKTSNKGSNTRVQEERDQGQKKETSKSQQRLPTPKLSAIQESQASGSGKQKQGNRGQKK